MKEYNTRQVAKDMAEHITPEELRLFLSQKINQSIHKDNLTVLEPSIGSGQLLFNIKDKITHITGFDINENALQQAKSNFQEIATLHTQDFITAQISDNFDIAVANYPFSLKATDGQKKFIANDNFLKQFFIKSKKTTDTQLFEDILNVVVNEKDITGVLDFIFILKSFQYAQEGFYFAFPGIGYREQEKKFRKYLFENKLIKELGILHNCNFEYTTISILYIHLSKEPCKNPKAFYMDFKTKEFLECEAVIDEDYKFNYPQPEVKKEVLNPIELEKQARERLKATLIKELEFSRKIYLLDQNLQYCLPNIDAFKEELIDVINNI